MSANASDTKNDTIAKLIEGPITGHLVSQTLPGIIGVAAIMSIGLVDAYFIGQLGNDPLAAISFIFPVSVALSSLGVGVMVGINSVVSRALGEGDEDKAQRRATFGIVFALACGLLLAACVFALIDPLFEVMNAQEAVRPLIRTYMVPYSLGFPLLLLIMGFNGVLRAQGEARRSSYVNISYAAANWVLDPLLITGAFGLDGFGIVGAAYATVAGWGVGLAFALLMVRQSDIRIDLSALKRSNLLDPAVSILKVGGPAAFSNAINPIGLSILTAIIASQGQDAVAGFGAAGRLQSFATVPLLALSGSIGAIVGQNWGAREFERAREAAIWAGGFCIVWGLGTAILLFAAGEWFGALFTDDPAVIREFALYIRVAAWGYAGFGVLIVANGILNAVDKAGFALTQSILRVFLVMLPFALLMDQTLGSSAIYAAELAANLFGGITGAALVWWVLGRVARR
ncbi:MAG: MATE family efflux transporter [Erythrobacter sp.]|uniref:MATE family efflux transporter n=1 Tax=Erythrobacter sp. TaxID=1042 RepID=UPI00260AA371|nr:MATE family efflux transporter [Erythrobacter sp.]MDJ0978967.1 MATE family efflux transporter [Erythrobacter sp.]